MLPDVKALVEDYRAKILGGEVVVCDAFFADSEACTTLLSQ